MLTSRLMNKDSLIASACETISNIRNGLTSVIRGRDDTIKLVLTGLVADGHVLLEDYPGSGKTTLSKTLGKLISGESQKDSLSYIAPFRRIQFTPDLLPGDVLGINIFEPRTGEFRFVHGPVFAHIVLADEINRTGPKVQAAFLECMAEKQVTVDAVTYPLDQVFFVIGTQNPLDVAGTYPLPSVQLDRFLLRIPMSYVDSKTELEILKDQNSISEAAQNTKPVASRSDIINAQVASRQVHIAESVRTAIVSIVQATRSHPLIQFGASTRAALMLQNALQSWALIEGRDYVTEDDLKHLTPYVLAHRMKFLGGAKPDEVLKEIMLQPLETLIRSGLR